MSEGDSGSKKRFGVFEFDPLARELTKHGVSLKVQEQPIQILIALLDQPGRIVTREELQRRLWPDGTFVDFEQSLNKAVNKLREALGDSASHPLYIETVARRGYRFLAPVESDQTVKHVAEPAEPRRRLAPWLAGGGFILAIVLGTGLWPIDVPHVESVVQLTNDTTLKAGVEHLISDGTTVLYGDGNDVWSVPASGGQPKRLSLPFLQHAWLKGLANYSPVRQQILLISAYAGSGPYGLWLAGTEGETPHKIAELKPPSRVVLAPDAERIAFSMPDGIYIQALNNGERKRIHSMAGTTPTLLWWHPSGHRVGFLAPADDVQRSRAWQVNDDGTHLRRIVPEMEHGQGAGAWSQDGKKFFYLGGEGEVFLRIQSGLLGWLRQPVVTRLSARLFRTPPALDPANPRRLYAMGSTRRGETMRYDQKARRWVSFLEGFSGEQIDRSPDGQWLAYITFPGSELHMCKIDGSSDVLLVPGVEAINPSWSPDGTQIAFSGRPTGTFANFKLWLVSPGGRDAAPYAPVVESGYDTIWSGDGKRILIGQDGSRSRIRILHLKTGELESIGGTERLFSPRWSPGEERIVALESGTMKLRILDPVKGAWRTISDLPVGYPKWSRDGKYIYAAGIGSRAEAIRLEVATGRREEIAPMDFIPVGNNGFWLGWTADWEPLTVRDLSSTQVYRIDLDR
jgi:DNA-binding winged helix-turn-helix (wHTH) protein/Tol biopolymer transport system component